MSVQFHQEYFLFSILGYKKELAPKQNHFGKSHPKFGFPTQLRTTFMNGYHVLMYNSRIILAIES